MSNFLHDLEWVLPFRNAVLTPVFEFFSALGYTVFFCIALPLLYWAGEKNSANRIAVGLLGSVLLNYFLKDWFQDPRPDPALRMSGHEPTSFGLPSGHTQLAIVFWGGLALEVGKRWARGVATIFIVGIAFSRLYLGVHDVEDVLGGAILGGIGLACIFLWRRKQEQDFRVPLGIFVGIAFVAVLFFWPGEPPGKVVAIVGFTAGWIFGFFASKSTARPQTVGKAVASVLLGLIGLAAGGWILIFLFGKLNIPEMVAQVVGGIICGMLVTSVFPRFFARLGFTNQQG